MFITRRMPFYFNADEATGGSGEQAPSEDTPDITGVEPDSQPTVDWEDRYKNLQSDHTRKSQRLAELERIYEGARNGDPAAIEALGLVYADQADDDEPESTGTEDQFLTRAEWEQYQQTQQAEREQEQRIAAIDAFLDTSLNSLGYPKGDEGSDEDVVRDWIITRAIALPPDEDGNPNVAAAHEQFQALVNAQKKSWAKGKRAPHVSQAGQAATQNLDLDDGEQRRAWMLQRLAESQQ